MSEAFRNIPAVALRGLTVLPGMMVNFDISRPKSLNAVERVLKGEDRRMLVVAQRDAEVSDPGFEDLYRYGTIVAVKQVIKLPKGIQRVMAEGTVRAELRALSDEDGYLSADAQACEEADSVFSCAEEEAMLRGLKDIFAEYARVNPKLGRDTAGQALETADLLTLVDKLCINLPLYYKQRQQLLETFSLAERYARLCVILSNEAEVLKIKAEIQTKVKERIDKNQRDYILREQQKLIREELGEDTTGSDADHYLEQTEALTASEEVKDRIKKEIARFKSMGYNSSESTVLRGYIETLLELPWDKASEDNHDLKNAWEILEADHYGLEKVKERVMEFLAVRSLTRKGESPILCLVGPPGTGKTSIARSVARALNKKYVRISLGGVRDEAEIRGHRRTYVGAMPGRIAAGMRSAGVKNPLMLLDEIDKSGSDYKGDTASALLEVLDVEQNGRFRDHYVEIPLDLSEVLFIATANDVQNIPRPLLDRMELIEISSYTENEKLHIAKEHLLGKQIAANGLEAFDFSVTDGALEKIISAYTKEAGVRSLERKLGQICRKAARQLTEEKRKSVRVTKKNLESYLGRGRYTVNRLNDKNEVGIVRGLAWTNVGGDTLEIEVNVMPGKGEILLTGQLGDVMKESARAGVSYIRSVAARYGIPDETFKEKDIHIHIPEGAVPKDGPSAGITMATAMLSALTQIPVRADTAMTGEITLRGRVLPIGGLKEKLLAAGKAGMRQVLVPAKNRPDVEEISEEIREGLTIRYVEQMDEVLKAALAR